MADLSFILIEGKNPPSISRVIANAKALGIPLVPSPDETTREPNLLSFDLPGSGHLLVMRMPIPHPDAPGMPVGATSPSPDEIATCREHLLVTAVGLTGSARERDVRMAVLTAAVVRSCDAVGAMLAHGVLFHKAGLFADLAEAAASAGALPIEIAVDVTAAREPGDRVSFLTHGMQRYDREELFVTCPERGRGALGFVYGMTRWLLTDTEKVLPTGDTVGRSAEEKILVQRVPSPIGEGPSVIRLDLES